MQELLVAPAGALDDAARRSAADRLAAGFDRPVALTVRALDAVLIAVVNAGDGVPAPGRRGAIELVERDWPQPLGLRARFAVDGWSVETDTAGVRPLYVARDAAHGTMVSTQPALLAGLRHAAPDPVALAELLVVGFTLGSRTPFVGVERLRPGARVAARIDRGPRVETPVEPAPPRRDDADAADAPDWIASVAPIVTRTFADGAALELSGGVDSRLVLALGLAHGVRPAFAFTLGADDDEDVRLARDLCRRHDVDHRIVPVRTDHPDLAADARAFAASAGFGVSATTTGWLPGALRGLDAARTHQVAGGGGECAAGFYDTPLDGLAGTRPGLHAWIVQRLFRPDVRLDAIFTADRSRELFRTTVDAARAALDETDGTFRDRSAALYRRHRVTNAGGPVLAASAALYRPHAPLLHEAYLDWGRALRPAARSARAAQFVVLAALCPDLAASSYSGGRRNDPTRVADALRRGRRVAARLARRPRPADLGATGTAVALAADAGVRDALSNLAAHPALGLRTGVIERALGAPASHAHVLGMLITTAWAVEEAAADGRALLSRL